MRIHTTLALPIILFAVQFCQAQTAALPTATASQIKWHAAKPAADLLITATSELRGRVVDRQGKPMSGVQVSLFNRRAIESTAQSDTAGNFTFQGVTSGMKVIRASEHMQPVRVWQGETAPPNAKHGVLLVAGAEAVRAQCCDQGVDCGGCDACCGSGLQGHFGGVFQHMLQNPWLIGAGTAAAIAIPIAVGDDDERDGDFASQLITVDAS